MGSSRALPVLVAIASAVGGCGAPAADSALAPRASAQTGGTAAASIEPTATASAGASSGPTNGTAGSPGARRAAEEVQALSVVKDICKDALAGGAARCSAAVTDAPTKPCPRALAPYRDAGCMWIVSVVEAVRSADGATHDDRAAMFLVDPQTFEVRWGFTRECPDLLFTLPGLREVKRRAATNKALSEEERCQGAVVER